MQSPQIRRFLFLITFSTAVLSVFFFVVSSTYHQIFIASKSFYRDFVGRIVHPLMLLCILPLTWSTIWSFVAFRTSRRWQEEITPITEKLNNSIEPRHRDCGFCTCSPWFNRKGPHPVFALIIELLLCLMLITFGVRFGLLCSDYYKTFPRICHLSHLPRSAQQPANLFCQPSYWTVLGFEGCALIMLMATTLGNLGLLVISIMLVYRNNTTSTKTCDIVPKITMSQDGLDEYAVLYKEVGLPEPIKGEAN